MHNIGNPEIIQIADAVAREKNISKESVIVAMEQAVQVAGRRKYGLKHDIRAKISRKNGEIKLYRVYKVVETAKDLEDTYTQMTLDDAKNRDAMVEVGGEISEELPPIDLGRIAAQSAKQVIVQKVREVEKDRQYEQYKDKVGEVVNGLIKRHEYGNVIVDLAGDEALILKDQIIPGETFRQNDRVRAVVKDVKRSIKGSQIFLSRTDDEFLVKLFKQEVPEVYEGVIDIKSVAREPGSRAKIAVYATDMSVDAVGSCVGVRGARVQAVTSELQGEKIDVINWSSDLAFFVEKALAPADVAKVVIDEENKKIEVVVATDQLSLAIGKKGQNVRLAAKLIGWRIDVLTEDEESARRSSEFNNATAKFMQELDVEEVIAQLLAVEGFASAEEIAYASEEELLSIEGFEIELVQELISRAKKYIDAKDKVNNAEIAKLGAEQNLIELLNLPSDKALILVEKGIKTIEDLADLKFNEFKEFLPNSGMSDNEINKLIEIAKNTE